MTALNIAARAPNHLGDGVMALPALSALTQVGSVTIHAPAWGHDLYRDLPARVTTRRELPTGDVAVLFPPSFRVAWEARSVPRRIGVASDGRGWLLTDVVSGCDHRSDTYRALARVLGSVPHEPPRWESRPGDVLNGDEIAAGHVGLNPVSVSGGVREWTRFSELAHRLKRPVVFYGGPGEEERVHAISGDFPSRVGLSLPAFGRALQSCSVFVSNDSGAAHFARACGVSTVVLHGSTTFSRTGPAGAVPVEGPEVSCRPCYRQRCRWEPGSVTNLWGTMMASVRGVPRPGRWSCLEVSLDEVCAAVERVL